MAANTLQRKPIGFTQIAAQCYGGMALKIYRRLSAALFAMATVAAVGVLSGTPANAAPVSDRAAPTTLTVSSVARDARGIHQTITCTITVQNPHKSSHVPGTINVISRVQCTAPVAGIASALGLYWNYSTLVSSNSATNTGVAALQINTTTPCVNGTYDALGLATIFFPAGYTPPTGDIGAWSSAVSIAC